MGVTGSFHKITATVLPSWKSGRRRPLPTAVPRGRFLDTVSDPQRPVDKTRDLRSLLVASRPRSLSISLNRIRKQRHTTHFPLKPSNTRCPRAQQDQPPTSRFQTGLVPALRRKRFSTCPQYNSTRLPGQFWCKAFTILSVMCTTSRIKHKSASFQRRKHNGSRQLPCLQVPSASGVSRFHPMETSSPYLTPVPVTSTRLIRTHPQRCTPSLYQTL